MSRIIPFLNRKVFFITGATGFLGKGVVEKILRHAPDVERIYLMIRPRLRTSGKIVTAQERLDREIIQANVFGFLRRELGDRFEPLLREKLVAVSSDLTQDRLGMDEETYDRLTREVDLVINSAATVVFNEPLDMAMVQNTLGPMRIVEFAKACRNAALIHVSTAYVSGQRTGKIKEETPLPNDTAAQAIGWPQSEEFDLDEEIKTIQIYSDQVEAASLEPERIAEFHRVLDKEDCGKRVTEHRRTHQAEALRQRWKREKMVDRGSQRARELGWHDSYTMTKAMGERMIVKTRGDLPVVIVRPSVIESSLADPEPGWLDGLKVADPLIAHFGKGRLLDFPARPDVIFDVIPVDIIVNVIIGVLPTVKAEKDVKVYHVCTGDQNPMNLGEMVHLVYEYFLKTPMLDRKGRPIRVQPWKYPSLKAFHRKLRYRYQVPVKTFRWVLDRAPGKAFKKLRRQLGLLDATLENARELSQIYSTYVQLPCEFQTDHMRQLHDGMDAEDREIFNCDVSRIDWRTYIQDIHIPGLKRHVLKSAE